MLKGRTLGAIGLSALVLTACDLTRSEEAIQARIGQSLQEVINVWGAPSGANEVAGRTFVYWEQTELSSEDVPSVSLETPIGNGKISATIPLSDPDKLTCRRTVQLDRNERVVSASLEGNNCPYYAPNDWS